MLRQVAQRFARIASQIPCETVAPKGSWSTSVARAAATQATVTDAELQTKDVYGLLAKMMFDNAAKAKKQDALKADVQKVLALLDENTAESGPPEKLKDSLSTMGKRARNELFTEIVESEDMKTAQPALKEIMGQLAGVGEPARIIEVAYKYLELAEGRAAGPAPLTVDMTVAAQESAQEIDAKKAMLVNDMIAKGTLTKGQKVAWNVNVDPAIKGGVIFHMGDVLVDCSIKSLQDEFFDTLANAGIERVE